MNYDKIETYEYEIVKVLIKAKWNFLAEGERHKSRCPFSKKNTLKFVGKNNKFHPLPISILLPMPCLRAVDPLWCSLGRQRGQHSSYLRHDKFFSYFFFHFFSVPPIVFLGCRKIASL